LFHTCQNIGAPGEKVITEKTSLRLERLVEFSRVSSCERVKSVVANQPQEVELEAEMVVGLPVEIRCLHPQRAVFGPHLEGRYVEQEPLRGSPDRFVRWRDDRDRKGEQPFVIMLESLYRLVHLERGADKRESAGRLGVARHGPGLNLTWLAEALA
jgi:hypothetical protein